jgi:hypothetical protein
MDFLSTVELMNIYDEEQKRFGSCSNCTHDLILGNEVYISGFFEKTNNNISFCCSKCYENGSNHYDYLKNYTFKKKIISENDIKLKFKQYPQKFSDNCSMLYRHPWLTFKHDHLSFFAYIHTILKKDKPTQKEKLFLEHCRKYNYL